MVFQKGDEHWTKKKKREEEELSGVAGLPDDIDGVEEPEPKPKKRVRIPMGGHRLKMRFDNQDPNYFYRWFNDTEGRIPQAEAGGYEFVSRNQGNVGDPGVEAVVGIDDRICQVVDRTTGMKAYLMRINREWYDEDKGKEQDHIDQFERQLFRGDSDEAQAGQDGIYIPEGGMKLEHGR